MRERTVIILMVTGMAMSFWSGWALHSPKSHKGIDLIKFDVLIGSIPAGSVMNCFAFEKDQADCEVNPPIVYFRAKDWLK